MSIDSYGFLDFASRQVMKAWVARKHAGSLSRYVLLLLALCIFVWVTGALFDVQLFPWFKLFQAGLATPMMASLLLT